MANSETSGSLRTVAVCLLGFLVLAGSVPGQDRKANSVAAERLRLAVERDYSYRDRLKIDWKKRFADYQPQLLGAADKEAFARTTVEFLSAAKDVHISLKNGERTLGTHRMDLRPNINPRVLPRLIPKLEQHGKTVLIGSWPDGIRYVAIATWDDRDPAATKKAVAAVKEAARARAPLILDVRPNMGGDEIRARQVAGVFVAKPTAYASHISRARGKDLPPQRRVLNPDPEGIHHPGPCVVLMGPANISSCESFLLMMRAAGYPLVGSRSSGSSGNPQPHDLGNGLVVMLPSWRNLSLDGRELEGVGIAPDISVEAQPGDFTASDPVLIKALEHLRARAKK